MRYCLALYLLACSLSAHAAETWLLKLDRWGNPSFMTLHVDDRQGRIEGTLDGGALTGTRTGNDVTLGVGVVPDIAATPDNALAVARDLLQRRLQGAAPEMTAGICCLGYGKAEGLYPRGPRLTFDDANTFR